MRGRRPSWKLATGAVAQPAALLLPGSGFMYGPYGIVGVVLLVILLIILLRLLGLV